MKKKAVILFNLGGPDNLQSVHPFLFNLFNDPAILSVPKVLRSLLARFISWRRAPTAREIYRHLGGKSPLLEQTNMQAEALEKILRKTDSGWRVFVAMRYWHPFTADVVAAVKNFSPNEILLVPLYPQYSSTTSGSSLKLWAEEAEKQGLRCPTRTLCCYPEEDGFITALAKRVGVALSQITHYPRVRVLLSAHGLPERVIKAGDPYQSHVEKTCRALIAKVLSDNPQVANAEWVTCYQSRVGPLKWIGPATDEEIKKAGRNNIPVVVVPVAFVSEHSETLVELDIEYRQLAQEHNVPAYKRVMTVQCDAPFIEGLAHQIQQTLSVGCLVRSGQDERICTGKQTFCPHIYEVTPPAMKEKNVLSVGSDAYLWVKTLHVISIITWMAGLFYLPRLYVYHAEASANPEQSATFNTMERRLLAYIMNPSAVVVFSTGAILSPFWLGQQGWLHLKILLVVLMAACHVLYAFWQRDFLNETNTRSGRFYRIANEIPTVLLIVIIALVIVKPF